MFTISARWVGYPTVAAGIAATSLRCAHGRRYSKAPEAYELAREINYARFLCTLQKTSRPSPLEQKLRNRMDRMAQRLLAVAMESPKKLRLIAHVLDEEESHDPGQANIIGAYLASLTLTGHRPTLAELRKEFAARFGKQSWRGNFSVRKTLKLLRLPLAKAKRGRPHGSRSKISNPRGVKQ